jgi:hypothetical protein
MEKGIVVGISFSLVSYILIWGFDIKEKTGTKLSIGIIVVVTLAIYEGWKRKGKRRARNVL